MRFAGGSGQPGQSSHGQRQQAKGVQFAQRAQANEQSQQRRVTGGPADFFILAHQQQQGERAKHNHGVVVVNRGRNENEHRVESGDAHSSGGQPAIAAKQPQGDGIGGGHGYGGHRYREKAAEMHRQHRPAPRPLLAGGVDDNVFVVRPQRVADGGVGVVPENIVPGAGVYPAGKRGGQRVVQRRLVALVAPMDLGLAGLLDGQLAGIGHVFDHRVMARFVAGFKRRGNQAVNNAQSDERQQNRDSERVGGEFLNGEWRMANVGHSCKVGSP